MNKLLNELRHKLIPAAHSHAYNSVSYYEINELFWMDVQLVNQTSSPAIAVTVKLAGQIRCHGSIYQKVRESCKQIPTVLPRNTQRF